MYYTELEYRGAVSSLCLDKNKTVYGSQAGLGAEIRQYSASASLEASYAIVNLNADGLGLHRLDYWQVVFTIHSSF